jgi:uncharacterized pyridoxal phosphate-containing UPF0001 family protein
MKDDDIVNIVGCLVFDSEWHFIGTVDTNKLSFINKLSLEK